MVPVRTMHAASWRHLTCALPVAAREAALARDAAEKQMGLLRQEQQSAQQSAAMCERLVASMEEELKRARADREEATRLNADDKETLTNIFRELEAQLGVARQEREELQTRAERERRAMAKRVRELEEALHAEKASRRVMRVM